MRKEDIFYEALRTRDYRFDGKFFVGVKTTGVYCRPICPAKPKRENVEFFQNYLEAEIAGYRPCMRCHPESAPHSPLWMGKSAVVQRALRYINSMEEFDFNEDEFALLFGVSARHLRRLFIDELGKTPKQLVLENQLSLARKLVSQTGLSMSEVAFASGFSSIRRFNDAFKNRFKQSPSIVRKSKVKNQNLIKIGLSYRPPFDYEGLFKSYQNHQTGKLERFEDHKMYRIVEYQGKLGEICIENNAEKNCLDLTIDFPDTSAIQFIVKKVRNLFDLDSDPILIANSFEKFPILKKFMKKHPGIRLPSGWDSFEVAMGTILGQLVSIQRGRALVEDLIEIAGREVNGRKMFPTPEDIIKADLSSLKTTNQRKETIKNFCRAISVGNLSLDAHQNMDDFRKVALAIKGIGPWSVEYMALRALRDPDAFPASDLIINRVCHLYPEIDTDKLSPWRGYLASLFWHTYVEKDNK